jgi:pimeloyl-ACP methyl ester carboxylesterase
MTELESLDIPALVVASRDEADPGHPYAIAEAWAESLPDASFVTEEPGNAPFAWQGGKLAREIADFAERIRSSR